MINYSCIPIPWNRGFIIEILHSAPLFSVLHIQTGLAAAGFSYVLKCLARAEAVEDIFNLVSLQRSWVIAFQGWWHIQHYAGEKLHGAKLTVWAGAEWAVMLLSGSNPDSHECFKGPRALLLTGTSLLLLQSVAHFWLLGSKNSLIVNVWALGFISDCTDYDSGDHLYLCVCFYLFHCKMQVTAIPNVLILSILLSRALKKLCWTGKQGDTAKEIGES